MQVKKKYFMEKIEIKAKEIKKEGEIKNVELENIEPEKVSSKKEKIKRKRTVKKIVKPVEMKAETIQKEGLAEEVKIEKPEVEKLEKPKLFLEKNMDDIFKSKEEMEREEKINNLFKSASSVENLEGKSSYIAPESEKIIAAEPQGKKWKVWANILVVVIFLGLAITAGYLWWQYKKAAPSAQTATVADETVAIVEKIKNQADLPPETPVLATITDPTTDQPLFSDALSGDKVLIYIQAKKAILYRPSSNEVIETINLLSSKTPETGTGAANLEKIETKVKVDVLNGTEIKGLAKETANKLSGMENVEVAKTSNAQGVYTKILVVDISGKNAIAAKLIAQKLGGETGALPVGESKGIADILVIAGK